MTIRKGTSWGEPGELDPGAPTAADDSSLVEAALAAGWSEHPGNDGATTQVGITGGDLHRSLGSPRHTERELRAGEGMRLPVDLGAVELLDPAPGAADAQAPSRGGPPATHYFCAHLVCIALSGIRARAGRKLRRHLFAQHTILVMNVPFMGDDNIAPRAHPNDGALDLIEGRLPRWDRIRALRRLPTGTHVPHPELAQRRVRSAELGTGEPLQVFADGRLLGTASRLRVRCVPDALVVVA